MKEAAEQSDAIAEPGVAPAGPAPLPLSQVGQVLALQRSAGNRAVAQMLARADATTIKKHVREETTGAENVNWDASFDVSFVNGSLDVVKTFTSAGVILRSTCSVKIPSTILKRASTASSLSTPCRWLN